MCFDHCTGHDESASDDRASGPLHEWSCPSCGATTRARMADTSIEPLLEARSRALNEWIRESYTSRPHRDARRAFLAGWDARAAALRATTDQP